MLSKAQTRLLVLCALLWLFCLVQILRWNGNHKLRSATFPFAYAHIACTNAPIIWGQQELLFCGSDTPSLVAVDYRTGNARIVAQRKSIWQPDLLLGDASTLVFDDNQDLLIVDLMHGGAIRVAAPCVWMTALAWSGRKIRLLCAASTETEGEVRRVFSQREIRRDGTVEPARNVGEFASTAASVGVRAISVTPARFFDNQWWFLLVKAGDQVWENLHGTTLPAAAVADAQYELLAAGQFNARATSLIAADGTVIARRSHQWATGRLELRANGLQRVTSERLADGSFRVTVGDTATTLRYQPGDIDRDDLGHQQQFHVSVAGDATAATVLGAATAAANDVDNGVAPIPDGAGGWYLTGNSGTFAHVDHDGARLDPLHYREYNQRHFIVWRVVLYLWPAVIALMLLFAWLRRAVLAMPSKIPVAQVRGAVRLPRLYYATALNTLVLAAAFVVFIWVSMFALME